MDAHDHTPPRPDESPTLYSLLAGEILDGSTMRLDGIAACLECLSVINDFDMAQSALPKAARFLSEVLTEETRNIEEAARAALRLGKGGANG